ncbi:hypothetical protein T439DRAFT_323993 [Meredithblackwellia eburnea MCA 4105]
MSFDPFPPAYKVFFATVEPLLTAIGVFKAVFTPLTYHKELIPPSVAAIPLNVHPASVMSVRQLGSCFFLLALMATFLLRTIHSTLASQPVLLEKVIYTYLWCLAVADLTHIGFTFYDLGLDGSLNVAGWNQLVWGNCAVTAGLFLARMLWFAGVGRGSGVGLAKKTK